MTAVAALARVELDAAAPCPLAADRDQAIADLAADNAFARRGADPARGPFSLRLSARDGRLVFDLRDRDGAPDFAVVLALGPFRRLVKDYATMVESLSAAAAEGRADRIQAIDMGRRGVHDEGAALLRQRLDGKIDIDMATARRLFTLVCALQWKAAGG